MGTSPIRADGDICELAVGRTHLDPSTTVDPCSVPVLPRGLPHAWAPKLSRALAPFPREAKSPPLQALPRPRQFSHRPCGPSLLGTLSNPRPARHLNRFQVPPRPSAPQSLLY